MSLENQSVKLSISEWNHQIREHEKHCPFCFPGFTCSEYGDLVLLRSVRQHGLRNGVKLSPCQLGKET